MRWSLTSSLRHPVSAAGVALTTATGVLFVVLVTLQLLGIPENPYAGIVVFVMVPALFVAGLLLIPVGLFFNRRRARRGLAPAVWPRIDLGDAAIRRTLLFVVAATIVNLAIVSMASYGAVQYTESQAFCGQVCHAVMEPEFVAHQAGPHGRVPCVACHIGPGAQGYLDAKLSGTRQLVRALAGTYHRPIPTPIDHLPDVEHTCESCHQPDRFVGDRVKVIYEYADDQANTQTVTTLRLNVGGPTGGAAGTGTGIHWHVNRANRIDYVALDAQRERISYVRLSTPDGQTREYLAEGVTADDVRELPRRRMDCLDCHNRPAHTFSASLEREVDAAIGARLISTDIPFIRREAIRALRSAHATREAALEAIAQSIRGGVAVSSGAASQAKLEQAIAATRDVYRRNVFPANNVAWGTYVNQLGHTTATGCFRCHDAAHTTAAGETISQDCERCHAFE